MFGFIDGLGFIFHQRLSKQTTPGTDITYLSNQAEIFRGIRNDISKVLPLSQSFSSNSLGKTWEDPAQKLSQPVKQDNNQSSQVQICCTRKE